MKVKKIAWLLYAIFKILFQVVFLIIFYIGREIIFCLELIWFNSESADSRFNAWKMFLRQCKNGSSQLQFSPVL